MRSYESLIAELEELKLQLQEANDTIEAIRFGQVDALVVKKDNEHQLYTLKSADQTYRVFIEKMKEGAITLNRDEIIVYSNSQFASMVNLPLANVIGLSFLEFVHPESIKSCESLIKKGWKSDSKGEIFLVNKDHEPVPFFLSLTSLELDEGQALSIVLTNLSAQKETERQLKQKNIQLEEARLAVTKINEHLEELVTGRTNELFQSRERFKFLADNIPVMVWTTNASGKLDYVNRRWMEYTGFDVEDSKAKQAELMHPEELEKAVKMWREAVKNEEKYEYEFRFRRSSDQSFRWHHAKAIPFKDENGKVTGWIGTSIDIDDSKKELEQKDEFIGVASHELKTPLTSLKGYLQLMEIQQDLPDNIKNYISRGIISINKLQHLINELLDASRIKAGRLEFDKSVIDLGRLVRTCVENSRCVYSDYTIRIQPEENIFVRGNEERLEQVLMNLLNNAVKYSPEKKEILVSLKKINTSAVISVTDQGIGISPDEQVLIFERFYRSGNSKFISSGLGMGLYISNEIIKEHQGSITVKSKPNQGSEFSIVLPLAGE